MGVELTKGLAGEMEVDNSEETKSVEYSVDNIIMDGDTTTISHIHDNVSEQIGVWSDVGHAKKALYGHLMKLSTSHKSMSKSVVDYLVKCFGYVLTQNKGNPEGICEGCKVIPNHAFGDHSSCGSWCQYQKNPENYKHQSLPHGKDLEGDNLKADLVQVKSSSFLKGYPAVRYSRQPCNVDTYIKNAGPLSIFGGGSPLYHVSTCFILDL